MIGVILFVLGCRYPPLARVPGATRLNGSATSEILVGTDRGEVLAIDAFGRLREVETALGAPVIDLVGGPQGEWWALLDGGRLVRGTAWSAGVPVQDGVVGIVIGCEGLVIGTTEDPGLWTSGVRTVAFGGCEQSLVGGLDGRIDGQVVSTHAIRRIHARPEGLVWIDDSGATSCPGCQDRLPAEGVVDAWFPWEAPWVRGEVVWIEADGDLHVR